MEKIWIYKAEIETKHGIDTATLFDDVKEPQFKTEEEVIIALMKKLDFATTQTDDEDDEEEPVIDDNTMRLCLKKQHIQGYWDSVLDAEFCYNGYHDITIPKSIVRRIEKSAMKKAEKKKPHYTVDMFTLEYCPSCENEVVIYSNGVTACPCGCTGGQEDENKAVTNPEITQDEIDWYLANS